MNKLREINLILWLPNYLRQYKEIEKITDTENIEFKKLNKEIQLALNNQFILSCDIDGIKRYEKILNIIPKEEDQLEDRIIRVLSRWNDTIPYTYRGLIHKLNVLCGEGNYKISLLHNDYTIELIVYLIFGSQLEEIKHMLNYMIPANIVVSMQTSRRANAALYMGIASNRCKRTKVYMRTMLENKFASARLFVGVGVNRFKKSVILVKPTYRDKIAASKIFLGVGVKRKKDSWIIVKDSKPKSVLNTFVVGNMRVGGNNDNI